MGETGIAARQFLAHGHSEDRQESRVIPARRMTKIIALSDSGIRGTLSEIRKRTRSCIAASACLTAPKILVGLMAVRPRCG